MNNPSKKHHYVPRFLLKKFHDNLEMLSVFDKKTGSIYRSSADNTGGENNFNTATINNQIHNFEHLFDTIDSEASIIISRLIDSKYTWTLSNEDLYKLAIFVSAQFVRTIRFRAQIKQLNTNVKNWMEESSNTDPDVNNELRLPDLDNEEIKLIAAETLKEVESYASMILTRYLIILHNPHPGEFLISDNPVILRSNRPDKLPGLKVVGTDVYFPISPRHTLWFCCSSVKDNLHHNISLSRKRRLTIDKSLKALFLAIHEKKIIDIEAEQVEFYNSLQVEYSSRFIYSGGPDFKFVQEMLKESPKLKETSNLFGVGDTIFPGLPEGQIAIISQSETDYSIVEINIEPSEFDIRFTVNNPAKRREILSYNGIFSEVNLYQDKRLFRGMRDVTISIEPHNSECLIVRHADPVVIEMMKMAKELKEKRNQKAS